MVQIIRHNVWRCKSIQFIFHCKNYVLKKICSLPIFLFYLYNISSFNKYLSVFLSFLAHPTLLDYSCDSITLHLLLIWFVINIKRLIICYKKVPLSLLALFINDATICRHLLCLYLRISLARCLVLMKFHWKKIYWIFRWILGESRFLQRFPIHKYTISLQLFVFFYVLWLSCKYFFMKFLCILCYINSFVLCSFVAVVNHILVSFLVFTGMGNIIGFYKKILV